MALRRAASPAFLGLAAAAALLLPALGLGAIACHYAKYTYGLCHPERRPILDTDRAFARRAFPNLEEVSFEGQGGVTLRGWFVPPANGVVIAMAHGLWSNRTFFLPEATVFVRHGYGVLLFDARAHGESGGDVATWGDREAGDVVAAVRFSKRQPGTARVGVLGFSVGASAVAHAAADDPEIEAVILYATWTSLEEENAYKARKLGWASSWPARWGYQWSGVDMGHVRPIDDVPRFAPRPLLMISGGEDTDTPPWVMDRVFAAAREPKTIWHAQGIGHENPVRAAPEEYEMRVVEFLDRAYAKRDAGATAHP